MLRFSTRPSLPTDPTFGPATRPSCWAAAAGAANAAVALCRLGAPPLAIKSSLSIATFHACVTAAAELAATCGHDLSPTQTRSFGLAPQLRWTKAVSLDQRPPDANARAARGTAVAAHLVLEQACASADYSSTASQSALRAIPNTCNAALRTVTDDGPSAACWLLRCRASAAQVLSSPAPVDPDARRCLEDDHEQSLADASDAVTSLRHASGDSWRRLTATAAQ